MTLRNIFILAFFFFSSAAFAQTTTTPITNPITTNSTVVVNRFGLATFSAGVGKIFANSISPEMMIYGGLSGPNCGTNADGTTTCNSCENLTTNQSCNTKRIYNELRFSINFTTRTAGRIRVTNDNEATGQQVIPFTGYPPDVILPANTAITIYVRWGDICEYIFNADPAVDECEAANLLTGTAKRMRIGVDTDNSTQLNGTEYINNLQFTLAKIDGGTVPLCHPNSPADGACNFIAYPGDQKVYIENIRGNCSFPTVGGGSASAIRVFYQKADLGSPTQAAPSADLQVSTSTEACSAGTKLIATAENTVGSLTNGESYRFAIGIVDNALNVGLVTNITADNQQINTGCYDPDEWPQNCHMASPSEVIGLMDEDLDCFISTATYGTALHSKVKTFRMFRNQYLKTNWVGRQFVRAYYQYSPPLAQWIAKHEIVRTFVKILLWPIWAFASLSLQWPLAVGALLLAPFVFWSRRLWWRAKS